MYAITLKTRKYGEVKIFKYREDFERYRQHMTEIEIGYNEYYCGKPVAYVIDKDGYFNGTRGGYGMTGISGIEND